MRKWMALAALAGSAAAWAQSEWVAGRVVGVDAERSRVTLKHAPIKSVKMAAMTMRFKVADPSILAPYKVGDRVRFSVVLRDDELIVAQIERAP
jgi:Cu(I)/Ag(I) efflux system periplasmic protein CusF